MRLRSNRRCGDGDLIYGLRNRTFARRHWVRNLDLDQADCCDKVYTGTSTSLMKRRCLEIRAMRRGWKAWFGAIAATFAVARVSLPSKGTIHYRHISGTLHRSYIRSIGYGSRLYGLRARGAFGGRGTRFFAVGDPDSGLGFYPLPIRYRIGAWRYRVRHRRPPWQNPVLFAIAADAVRYNRLDSGGSRLSLRRLQPGRWGGNAVLWRLLRPCW
jgi:hypothetical protein